MLRLDEMSINKDGDLELIYRNPDEGTFSMGGSFREAITRVKVKRDRLVELRSLLEEACFTT